MNLKEIWEKYAEQYGQLMPGVVPYPSNTEILCSLHLEIAEQLYTIAELAAGPKLERVPEQVPPGRAA